MLAWLSIKSMLVTLFVILALHGYKQYCLLLMYC